jgi:hypothetical protein
MWELAVPFLTGGFSFWAAVRANQSRLRNWRSAAESCGLRVEEISSPWAWRMKLHARAEPLEVWIESARRDQHAVRITVAVPGPPGFSGVRIRRESLRPRGAREIEVGDGIFDSTFFVEGPRRLVFTLLDGETRGLLKNINALGPLGIAGSEIRAEMSEGLLDLVLPMLLDVGRRFAQRVDVAQRLAGNAGQDSEAGVRLSNLRLLVDEFPGEPGTLETLRNAAWSDPSPGIRLRAASGIGVEGHAVLVELAEGMVEDPVSAQAVSTLGRNLPFERVRAILDLSLRRRRLQTAHACLEALGSSGDAADVNRLAKVMALEQGELAAAAALALGVTGCAAAEPPLLLAFQREKTDDVRVAAAKALGRVGSAAAVLPLKEATERSAGNSELLRALRQAIAEIQSRLPGASPGQLSLAGVEAGQLSLAQAEAGQLSLAADPAGQLSLQPKEQRNTLPLV